MLQKVAEAALPLTTKKWKKPQQTNKKEKGKTCLGLLNGKYHK